MIEGKKIEEYEKFYKETGELKEKFSEASEKLTPIPSSFPTVERLVSFATTHGEMTMLPASFIAIHQDLHSAIKKCDEPTDVLNVVNENLAEIDSDIANAEDESKIKFLIDKKKLLIRGGQDRISEILSLKNEDHTVAF